MSVSKMQVLVVTTLLFSTSLCVRVTTVEIPPLDRPSDSSATPKTCPDTWFVPRGPDGECQCGHTFHGEVSCDQNTKEVRVLDCFCITVDHSRNKTVLGECPYNCVNTSFSFHDSMYHPVPRDLLRDDTNSVCGYLHRTGTLCGQCMNNYSRSAYSYTFDCFPCERSQWLFYVLAVYIPLTLFIIFVLAFRLSVVSPKLYGMITILQILASPINIRVVQKSAKYNRNVEALADIFVVTMGVWNLDFFRNIMPSVCLRINVLQLLTLDYLIALYPMIVTAVCFMILQLHYRGFGPVYLICRPFQRAFVNFRRGWNLQTTLIDSFVTFFILSTTKLVHVSVSFLMGVQLHDAEGRDLGRYWYEDASIKLFSSEHIPYAMLALTVIVFLIALPIALLVCYQFTFCQVCLTKAGVKGQVLEEFMQSFNRYYKDGSGGTWDTRWFAAFPIMARLGFYLLLFFPLTGVFYNLTQVYALLCSIVVFLLEPYKKEYSFHNRLEPCIYLSLSLITAGITGVNIANLNDRLYFKPMVMFTAVIAMVPVVYLSLMAVWWVCKRIPSGSRFLHHRISSNSLFHSENSINDIQ